MKIQGYIEKVNPDETSVGGKVWYLPHFSTQEAKFRVVYDGSTEFCGKSINQETLNGPDLLEPLLNVITCFYIGKYAAMADLKECFFHIGILSEQRNLFHILWFAEADLEPGIEIWYFTVHIWGWLRVPLLQLNAYTR